MLIPPNYHNHHLRRGRCQHHHHHHHHHRRLRRRRHHHHHICNNHNSLDYYVLIYHCLLWVQPRLCYIPRPEFCYFMYILAYVNLLVIFNFGLNK